MRMLLPGLLLLAGCATGTSVQAVCERQSYDDPQVKLLIAQQAGSPYLQANDQSQLHQAEAQAKLRCLRAHGAAPPGGVEPRRDPPLTHSLF